MPGLDFSCSAEGHVAGCCENANEHLVSIECSELFHYLQTINFP